MSKTVRNVLHLQNKTFLQKVSQVCHKIPVVCKVLRACAIHSCIKLNNYLQPTGKNFLDFK